MINGGCIPLTPSTWRRNGLYPLQFSIVQTVRPHEAETETRITITAPKVGRSADETLWGAKRLRVYALYDHFLITMKPQPRLSPPLLLSAVAWSVASASATATDHATDVSAESTAPLPQPSATGGHGELHELHVAKSTAGHKQKGNHGNHAQGSSSLLLVYFVTGPAYVLQRLQRSRAVSCERKTFLISYSVCLRFVCVCV